jgi:site-specific recombinase XerD
MEVSLAVKEFLAAKASLSPFTLHMYRQRLFVFAAWCKTQGLTLEAMTARFVRAFIQDVSKRPGRHGKLLEASTVRCYTREVKIFLSWCAAETELEVTISPTIAARVDSPRVESKVIETFSDAQIAAFFQAAEGGPFAVRNKAILAVLVDTGARASEVVGLSLDCVWLDPDDSFIKVTGKGKKEREIGLGRVARLALRRYITRYRKPARAQEKRVFLARGGVPLTTSGLAQLIVRLGRKAGIEGVRCSPHTFRHGFACSLLAHGESIYRVSRLMGHTSVRITEKYAGAISARQARQGGQSVLDHLKDS